MPKFSRAIEDYLKQIYLLEEAGQQPTGAALAQRLDVSHASITGMLKRLHELDLVRYEPYKPLHLTPEGRTIALEIVRHHRLLEAYLTHVVGMAWEDVHDEAEVLEHHISERFEALMAERLGNPTVDPHGHPIPQLDGTVPASADTVALWGATLGHVRIALVSDQDADVLRFLGGAGIVPGAEIEILEQSDAAGTCTVRTTTGQMHVLGRERAVGIFVTVLTPTEVG